MDHVKKKRDGFTKSANVHKYLSHNNYGYYIEGCSSIREAFDLIEQRHEDVINKKIRKDMNLLFEHVFILSEAQYIQLEKQNGEEDAKKLVGEKLKQYAKEVTRLHGFTFLGFELHLDEGHWDMNTGRFRRNVHAHLHFYNYCLNSRKAPLRELQRKTIAEPSNARTINPTMNQHFARFQDVAANVFSSLGFERGGSKELTGRKHLNKVKFVQEKLLESERRYRDLTLRNEESEQRLANTKEQFNVANQQLQELRKQKATWEEAFAQQKLRADKMLRRINQECHQKENNAKQLMIFADQYKEKLVNEANSFKQGTLTKEMKKYLSPLLEFIYKMEKTPALVNMQEVVNYYEKLPKDYKEILKKPIEALSNYHDRNVLPLKGRYDLMQEHWRRKGR